MQNPRGDTDDYDRYLEAMDASMRQKVALVAAHLLCEGEAADMGMGSGTGSHALAQLYPSLEVTGVDLDPEMVARAAERYRLPNLRFLVGDVSSPGFTPGSLEAILNSSVLHHVTTFSGYDPDAARRAIAAQAAQLAPGGVLIVRDFLDPGPGEVWLDLPADDFVGEADGDDPASCSTAALFERFSQEFRPLLPAGARGFDATRLEPGSGPPLPPTWRRYAVSRRAAVEFVLRKDYRASWDQEILEAYTFFTREGFEAAVAAAGLRVLASSPLRNPWILQNRFEGRFRWWAPGGGALDWPATNYLIVGQRIRAGEGVSFTAAPAAPLGYLERSSWRRDDGRVFDVIRRPGETLDVLPWYRERGAIHVLARRSYPRPIAGQIGPGLDGEPAPTWVTEPLNVQRGDQPIGLAIDALLDRFPGVGAEQIREVRAAGGYYPSPGGLMERVESAQVEIAPARAERPLSARSGFTSSGTLRAIEARQLLRAAQVGGLPDARLELGVYALLSRLGVDPGAWIGAALSLAEAPPPVEAAGGLGALLDAPRRRFQRADDPARFLSLRCARFTERGPDGAPLAERELEFVVPRSASRLSIAAAVLRRSGGTIWIGVEIDDLPAAQCSSGRSDLPVAPAWRLPSEIEGPARRRGAEDFVRGRLSADHGLEIGALRPLGGRYLPSPGALPEAVYPYFAEVLAEVPAPRPLRWIRLDEAARGQRALEDGHLRVAVVRAAHALGLARP